MVEAVCLSDEWIKSKIMFLNLKCGLFRISKCFLFEPDIEYYDDCESKKLNKACKKLCDHLGINEYPRIKVVGKLNEGIFYVDPSGGVEKGGGDIPPGRIIGHNITIDEEFMGNYRMLGGILAHEVVHFYLSRKCINLSSVAENEYLTELAGFFLGFGKIILNGMSQRITNKTCYGFTTFYEEKGIGYLTKDTYKRMYEAVNEFRGISGDITKVNVDIYANPINPVTIVMAIIGIFFILFVGWLIL